MEQRVQAASPEGDRRRNFGVRPDILRFQPSQIPPEEDGRAGSRLTKGIKNAPEKTSFSGGVVGVTILIRNIIHRYKIV